MVDTDRIEDGGQRALEKKAIRMAWITGFALPALYVLASGGVIGHAGLGGMAVLIFIYIPAIPVCAVLLRLVLTPAYRTLLNKETDSRGRRRLAALLAVLAAAFCGLLIKTMFFPYDTVNQAVRNIPEMEEYFHEHKEELEERRLQTDGGDKGYSEFYAGYSGFLQIRFCYDAKGPERKGYQAPYCYTHPLDDHWYIKIVLTDAH